MTQCFGETIVGTALRAARELDTSSSCFAPKRARIFKGETDC